MAETMTADRSAHSGAAEHGSLKDWSGWDYAPGVAFLVIGILALLEPPLASLATSVYLGAMLCVAGAFMLAGGIAGIEHRGGWLSVILGLLSTLVGVLVLINPIAGAVSAVWVLGAWFIAGGILELAMAFSMPAGKGWLMFVGIVNLVIGAWVVMMSPTDAFAFLGYFVGISLVLRGLWSLMFVADIHRSGHYASAAAPV